MNQTDDGLGMNQPGPQDQQTVELTPVIVQVPWYKKIFRTAQRSQVYWYLTFVMLFAVGIVISREIQKPTTQETHAGTNTANINFQPTNVSMPPNGTVQLWMTASSTVGFVDSEISFDPTLVQMAQEVTIVATQLGRTVTVTPMATANSTGKLSIVLALDPTKKSTPPTGTFQLATLVFTPKTTANTTAALSISAASSQVVSTDTSLFTVTTNGTSFALNVQTPTPTSSAVSPTPTPTVGVTPAVGDSTPPTVSISSPADGSTVTKNTTTSITATASDNIGVTKVVFQVNNSTICTATAAPYACSWTPRGKVGPQTITVKGYDAAGNTGTATETVTMQ